MEILQLIAGLFGATGLWRLLEFLFKLYSERRKQSAEIRNLHAQTETNIVSNWIQWSQTLEKRVKELETVAEENKELKKQIDSQRRRIVELEGKVEKVEKENQMLRRELSGLQNTNDGNTK